MNLKMTFTHHYKREKYTLRTVYSEF